MPKIQIPATLLVFFLFLIQSPVLAGVISQEGEESVEPKIVVYGQDGQLLDIADLKEYTGQIGYEIEWGHVADPKAMELHEEGRQRGADGNYEKAQELFSQANQVDPLWPYPLYDAAYTFLLMGDSEEALRLYRTVDHLAPQGFFTTKTAIDCLEREMASTIKPGSYLFTIRLESLDDQEKKRQILESLLAESPEFPVAWNLLAPLLPDLPDQLEAIEKGLAANPDPSTQGSLLINKGLVLRRMGEEEKGLQIIGHLVADKGTTINTKALAQLILATWE